MHHEAWGWACVCFTVYHMCDNMDGKHARRTRQTSRVGKVLDHAIDGTFGIIASCRICCVALFDYPESFRFALCCGMGGMLICHFSEFTTGSATLGTRLFSADELFLICSFALAWRATTSKALLQAGPALTMYVHIGWVVAMALMALLVVRRLRWLCVLMAFGMICFLCPSRPVLTAARATTDMPRYT